MKQKLRNMLPLIISMLIVSCSPPKQDKFVTKDCDKHNQEGIITANQQVVINIPELEEDKKLILDSIVKDVRYIQLETTDKSLIGEISQMEYFDDKYFILDTDKTRSLFVFDKEGKFLWKISRQGKGPGEYLNLGNFSIDYESKRINLYVDVPSKIMIFDFNNNFIEEIPVPFYTSSFASLKDNMYMFNNAYRSNPTLKQENNLVVTDKNCDIKYSYFPYDSKKINSVSRLSNPFYAYKHQKYYYDSLRGTVYSLNSQDTLSVRYAFDFGTHTFDMDEKIYAEREEVERYMKKQNIYTLFSVQESDDFLSFMIFGAGVQYGFYSKTTGNVIVGRRVVSTNNTFVSVNIQCSSGNNFIGILDPLKIEELKQTLSSLSEMDKEKLKTDKNLEKVLSGFLEFDNPILSIYTIKPF